MECLQNKESFLHMIKEISSDLAKPLRQKILMSHRSLNDCCFEGDLDQSSAHFGYYIENEIKAIATLLASKTSQLPSSKKMFRLRGMAVDTEYRGQNIGRKLIEKLEEYVKIQNGDLIWCDARIGAFDFYKKLGFKKIGESYEVPHAGIHYFMFKNLKT